MNEVETGLPLLKISKVAEILNISRTMAYNLVQVGAIQSVRIRSSRRVRSQDLEDFVLRNLSSRKSKK